MAVKTCCYWIILSNMTLASNRALTRNFSEVETQYRTSIISQNMPLEPSSNVPKIFRRRSCLDHRLVAPIKFNLLWISWPYLWLICSFHMSIQKYDSRKNTPAFWTNPNKDIDECSNISVNQVENMGIASCVNVTRKFFFKKSCKSPTVPTCLMLHQYCRRCIWKRLCFASAKLLSTNCTGLLQLPNNCQQGKKSFFDVFPYKA